MSLQLTKNLFVADAKLGLDEHQINRFVKTWLKFDPNRTLMLKSIDVIPMLMTLPLSQ